MELEMNEATTPKIRVLLCEDEPFILMAMADLLQEAGMEVLEAARAAAALDMLSASDVDILVTDVGLPDLTGVELALRARALKPNLHIVFSTGDRHVDGVEQLPGAVVMAKPCPDDELVSTIRHLAAAAIDRHGPTGLQTP
jgi:DNA-binding response OmpR family regulator